MARRELTVEVLGRWSLATSKQLWEGFAAGALPAQDEHQEMRSVFAAGVWPRARTGYRISPALPCATRLWGS